MSWGCMAAWTTWSGAAGSTSCPTRTSRPTWTSPTATSCGTSGKPVGFSSPGFYSDERVMALLDRFGFLYNGDAIGGRAAARHRRRPARSATGPFP